MRILFLIFCNIISLVAFAQKYSLQGKLSGFADGTKFYLAEAYSRSDIDSAVLTNGIFSMGGSFDEPQVLMLHTRYQGSEFYCPIIIGNERVTITGDKKDFTYDLNINGSKINSALLIRRGLTKNLEKKRDSLFLSLKSPGANRRELLSQISVIDSAVKSITLNFIKLHLNSYAALNELFFLKGEFQKDELQKMYNSLENQYKDSQFGKRIALYLKIGEKLKSGDMLEEFSAYDKFGKAHALSEIKGKFILLDFWYQSCPPCTKSVMGLKQLSSLYPNDIAVVSFSTDSKKDIWLKGIERDKPTWLSLWDGEGYAGATAAKYGVETYPTFFLINPEGKIIFKEEGYGMLKNGESILEVKVKGEVEKYLKEKL